MVSTLTYLQALDLEKRTLLYQCLSVYRCPSFNGFNIQYDGYFIGFTNSKSTIQNRNLLSIGSVTLFIELNPQTATFNLTERVYTSESKPEIDK